MLTRISIVLMLSLYIVGSVEAYEIASALFCGDGKLKAAAERDPAHIFLGHSGPHVGKLQQALIELNSATIEAAERQSQKYGPSTAQAVLEYKKRYDIRGPGQTVPDNVVGIRTTQHLDAAMALKGRCAPSSPSTVLAGGKTIEFLFHGIGGQDIAINAPSVVLTQQGQEVGNVMLKGGIKGIIKVPVSNPFNTPSYTAEIYGVTDPPKGEGDRLQQRLFINFPPDVFNKSNYLTVLLEAVTSETHFKNTKQTEIANKLGAELNVPAAVASGKIFAEIGDKSTDSIEQDWTVKYYTGGLKVATVGAQSSQ